MIRRHRCGHVRNEFHGCWFCDFSWNVGVCCWERELLRRRTNTLHALTQHDRGMKNERGNGCAQQLMMLKLCFDLPFKYHLFKVVENEFFHYDAKMGVRNLYIYTDYLKAPLNYHHSQLLWNPIISSVMHPNALLCTPFMPYFHFPVHVQSDEYLKMLTQFDPSVKEKAITGGEVTLQAWPVKWQLIRVPQIITPFVFAGMCWIKGENLKKMWQVFCIPRWGNTVQTSFCFDF